MKKLLKTYKNGNKLWGIRTNCPKCSGTGKVMWSYANHVCFDCDGKGWYYEEEREYTPENLIKHEAKLAKKREKLEAKQAKILEERARREAERLAEIERNRGNFIGSVGDRIEMTVTFVRAFTYEVPHPVCDWKVQTMTGYVFKTDEGNTLVWKTTGSLGYWKDNDKGFQDWISPEEGDRVTIKGTIKEHKEYNNVNQTLLNRVKWVA